MSNKRTWIIIAIILIAAIAVLAFRSNDDKQPTYTTTTVERGDVLSKVEATGTINAVTTVQVGSQVSGTIAKLNADFNTQVKKGQLIAQIDPSIFEGNLLQAKADLENARANLAAAQANLEKAKATALQAKSEYGRTQQLAKEGVFSQQQLEVAKSNSDSAEAAVSAAQAQVTQARAQVSQRSAAVAVAQTNLDHTKIIAPIDGTVVARSVDVGQTVAASLQAPTLFTIAQDLGEMQVYAKTDESDIGSIRPGQPVTFKVDAFPNQTFRGTVSQVRMNATVVQNVVTYDTIINFANPEHKLFPGMTAYVTIPVASAKDTLKVSNNALRFKPNMSADELKASYEKAGIPVTGRGASAVDESAGNTGGGSPAAGGNAANASGQQNAQWGQGRRGQGAQGGDASAQGGQGQGGWQGRRGQAGQGPSGAQSADTAQGGGGRGQWSGRRNGNGTGAEGTPGGGNGEDAAAGSGQRRNQGMGGGMQNGAPAGNGEGRARRVVVWKYNAQDKSITPVQIRVGITDLTSTAILDGSTLKEGDQLVTGSTQARGSANPFGRQGGGGGGQRPQGR